MHRSTLPRDKLICLEREYAVRHLWELLPVTNLVVKKFSVKTESWTSSDFS